MCVGEGRKEKNDSGPQPSWRKSSGYIPWWPSLFLLLPLLLLPRLNCSHNNPIMQYNKQPAASSIIVLIHPLHVCKKSKWIGEQQQESSKELATVSQFINANNLLMRTSIMCNRSHSNIIFFLGVCVREKRNIVPCRHRASRVKWMTKRHRFALSGGEHFSGVHG